MSMTSALLTPLFQIPPLPVRRFSVTEYDQMFATGILTEEDRVELLDGWITPKMTRNPPHDATLVIVEQVLSASLPPGWHLRSQKAATLPTSAPEPDVAIVVGVARDYRNRHPVPADIGLIVEVSDSTLDSDCNVKGPIYARAGIPTYWIVNLVDQVIEVRTLPGPGASQHRQDYTLTDDVPLVLAGQLAAQIPVVDLLG
jgi:Uma2 family endonuclease